MWDQAVIEADGLDRVRPPSRCRLFARVRRNPRHPLSDNGGARHRDEHHVPQIMSQNVSLRQHYNIVTVGRNNVTIRVSRNNVTVRENVIIRTLCDNVMIYLSTSCNNIKIHVYNNVTIHIVCNHVITA